MPVPTPQWQRAVSLCSTISLLAISGLAYGAGGGSAKLSSGQSWPRAQAAGRTIDAQGARAALLIRGMVNGARVGPVEIVNAYEAVETHPKALVSDLVIDGVNAAVQRGCVRVIGERVVVRNLRCTMVGGPQSDIRNLPFGLHVRGGQHIQVENSVFSGFQWAGSGNAYWNGDGVSVERNVSDISLTDVTADNNTDAGFDIKSWARLDRVSASGNCRNFRFWAGAEVGTMTVGEVVKRGGSSSCMGVWVGGGKHGVPPRLTIETLVVRMREPADIIRVEGGPASISIARCDIQAPRSAKLLRLTAASQVTLGPTCRGYKVVTTRAAKQD